MKAVCFMPTNLHALWDGCPESQSPPRENNGVRRVAGGEGVGCGGKVGRLGKSVGLKCLLLTPGTASAPFHSLYLPHCCWYGLHRAGRREGGCI